MAPADGSSSHRLGSLVLMDRPSISADTDEDVSARQVEAWRSMTPTERADLARRLTNDVTRIAIAGIRAQYPDATDDEVRYELARRQYGEEIAAPLRPGGCRLRPSTECDANIAGQEHPRFDTFPLPGGAASDL